jgi:ABC-type hemin transport system ATPase subunit
MGCLLPRFKASGRWAANRGSHYGREGAGLRKDVTFHSLLHTFGSSYMMGGGGLYRPRLRPTRRPETPMRDTPILILDDPTAGLEPASQQAVIGALDALIKGKTSVFIAHHLGTIRHTDVVEHGAHEALLAQNRVYAGMQRIQALEGAKIVTTQPSHD